MKEKREIRGKIVSGVKKGAFFTQLDWVRSQCKEKLGFDPYPGTLNLEVEKEIVQELMKEKGVRLVPPDPKFCEGRALRVSIGKQKGAIITPSEEVRVHGENVIEIMAPVRIKWDLGVEDGDIISIYVEEE